MVSLPCRSWKEWFFQYGHRWGVSNVRRTDVIPMSVSGSCRTSKSNKELRCSSFIAHNPARTFLDLNSLLSHDHLIGNVDSMISLNERYFKSIFKFNLLKCGSYDFIKWFSYHLGVWMGVLFDCMGSRICETQNSNVKRADRKH